MQQLLHRQAAFMEEMQRRNGWTYRVQIDAVLSGLGSSPADRQRPFGQLSSGWRNRAALAQILLSGCMCSRWMRRRTTWIWVSLHAFHPYGRLIAAKRL